MTVAETLPAGVGVAESVWGALERAAWAPPERLRPSEWAERYRVLSRRQSARPGPWRNAEAPYLVGIMDACVLPGVEELVIKKAGQVGASEAVRNVLGYWAHQDPDPVLLVLPDEKVGRKITRKRIIPLIDDTEVLAALRTETSHDVQLNQILLSNGFNLSLGWSGSPAALAADPQRWVINDEVDKFQEWSGREADPISLAHVRTRTYADRRLMVNISTPTTREGLIHGQFESCAVKLYYFVPCPHCGGWQRLSFDRLKWEQFADEPDADRRADLIEDLEAAWYECAHCSERIGERFKARMVQAGVWAVEGLEQRLDELAPQAGLGGIARVGWPAGKRVGLHISALYCLWDTWAGIAAEFVRVQGDPRKLMNFRNSTLGEVFEQQIASVTENTFARKSREGPGAGSVPDWATLLLSAADVQKDHIYWVSRAFGHALRSQRVAHGVCETFEELRERALDVQFPTAGNQPLLAVRMLGVDSAYRTEEVYRFALSDLPRIKPIKGEAEPKKWASPVRVSRVTYRPPGRSKRSQLEVWLHLLDTQHFKDLLNSKIGGKIEDVDPATGEARGEVEAWLLNDENDDDYNRQLAAEHKVVVPTGRGRLLELWVPITEGAANHYLDCECYLMALAHMNMALLTQGRRQRKSWRERRVRR